MAIFYLTKHDGEWCVGGDPGYEGKTVQVTENRGHTCAVKLAKSIGTANNGSTVYKTRYDVASGSMRAAIRSLALRIAKKHAFDGDTDFLADKARKAFNATDDPKLTPDYASHLIEELKELVDFMNNRE